jgi:hypothetical protein
MTTLEERIDFLSASSASISAQLNKLKRLKKKVRRTQAMASLKKPARGAGAEVVAALTPDAYRRGARPV